MKKNIKISSFVLSALISLSISSTVFGAQFVVTQDSTNNNSTNMETPNNQVVEVGGSRQTTKPKQNVVAPISDAIVTYSEISHTPVSFSGNNSVFLGTYPNVSGMPELTSKIYNELQKIYLYNVPNYNDYNNSIEAFKVSYELSSEKRYTKISILVTANITLNYGDLASGSINLNYFIDNSTLSEISEEVYLTGLTEQSKEPEKPTVSENNNPGSSTSNNNNNSSSEVNTEITLVPLRKIAERVGYNVTWIEQTKGAKISNSIVEVSIEEGSKNYYLNGAKISLSVAPILEDGLLYVPTTLFTEILKIKLEIDNDGNIVIVE